MLKRWSNNCFVLASKLFHLTKAKILIFLDITQGEIGKKGTQTYKTTATTSTTKTSCQFSFKQSLFSYCAYCRTKP